MDGLDTPLTVMTTIAPAGGGSLGTPNLYYVIFGRPLNKFDKSCSKHTLSEWQGNKMIEPESNKMIVQGDVQKITLLEFH